ncbi:hypothetical protein tinsulaeT_06870 [Thalassotalea insulae]|uniref:Uncharacterized protein n=1 Tax=Thalassotalea insulae TaxID=2056778 RepID=A0ABQ6GPP0_9GAMM|nr:hypothetical protein tinsulaeT_06870 [Thalassotalea insulae]
MLLFVSAMLIYNFCLGYLENVMWNAILVPFSITLLFSGYCLNRNKEEAYPYTIWVAVVNLIVVPIGTLASIYYIWFHFKFIKNKI